MPDNEGMVTRAALTAIAAVALVLLAQALTQTASPARPTAADELLRIESQVTYQIAPDEGPIKVTWQVALENNDPETARRDFGSSTFYTSLTVPILQGATSVEAVGPLETPLTVAVESGGESPIDSAVVEFDRDLHYEDTYEFVLSYDLPETRSEVVLATDSYVFLPAITSGDSSSVRILTTDDPGWETTIEESDCPLSPSGAFACGASEYVQIAAFVEVARAGVLTGSSFSVPLAAGDLNITLRHFPGEEAWAARMRTLAEAALPVLEDLFGVAYDGPATLEIAERGRQEIAGYEGTFGCLFDACLIGISPLASDSVAIHELAHLWTEPFENRWLSEGMAEYMSELAAQRLEGLVETFQFGRPQTVAKLQLDDWGRSRYLIGASGTELAIEETGYYKSRNLLEELQGEIGLDALQAANVAAFERGGGVDSETYMGLLEEASGVRLDALFIKDVFPASYGPVLQQRRDLQERLDALRPDARESGFGLPARIGQLIDEWDFDEAEVLLEAAERALQTYAEARDRVREPRSFWTDIGLIGKDPDSTLGEAADAFAATEFTKSQRLSNDAISEIDGARDTGIARFGIAVGIVVALLAVVAGTVWFTRTRPRYL